MFSKLHAMMFTCLAVGIVVAACSSEGTQTPATTPPPATSVIPPATLAPPPTPARLDAIPTPHRTPAASEEPSKPVVPTPVVPTPAVQPIPPSTGSQVGSVLPVWDLAPSIDEQIFYSDIIVVATLASVSASTESVPGDSGGSIKYRPLHVLQFRANQYLKGTGPNEFEVEIRVQPGLADARDYSGYSTEAAALQAAQVHLSKRNSAYDDRQGIVFLDGPLESMKSSTATSSGGTGRSDGESNQQAYRLVNYALDQSYWEYSVDSLSRTWLPAEESSSSGTRSTSETNFITDGTQDPPSAISFAALRTRISEIKAMMDAGDGSEDYTKCVESKLTRERYFRDWTPIVFPVTIPSGEDHSNHVFYLSKEVSDPQYFIYWQNGPDAQYFHTLIIDDDEVPSTGYYYAEGPARPLAEGTYEVNFHQKPYYYALCDFTPNTGYESLLVTAEAPAGTVHEAFFDPITVGTAVKADGSNGVLKPTSFTVGGTATEITSLEWANNKVVLTLDAHVSLSGHVLDFIALDGSVSLSLSATDVGRHRCHRQHGGHVFVASDQPAVGERGQADAADSGGLITVRRVLAEAGIMAFTTRLP